MSDVSDNPKFVNVPVISGLPSAEKALVMGADGVLKESDVLQTQQSALDLKQDVLAEGAFVDGDKTKLDLIDAPVSLLNASERKTLSSYDPDGVVVGVTRVIQADLVGILWSLVAADVTLDASWIGQPYTVDPDGTIVINMILSDVSTIITDTGTLGQNSNIPSIGDNSTIGGRTCMRMEQYAHVPDGTVFIVNDIFQATFTNGVGLLSPINPFPSVAVIEIPWTPYPTKINSNTDLGNSNQETRTCYHIPESVVDLSTDGGNPTTGGESIFATNLMTAINIPPLIRHLGAYTFSQSSLISLSIPETVTSMGSGMFRDCADLVTADLPSTIADIPSHTFNGCSSLQTVVLRGDVVDLGGNLFKDNIVITRLDMYSSSPPTVSGTTFNNTNAAMVIHVPTDATGFGATFEGFTVIQDL